MPDPTPAPQAAPSLDQIIDRAFQGVADVADAIVMFEAPIAGVDVPLMGDVLPGSPLAVDADGGHVVALSATGLLVWRLDQDEEPLRLELDVAPVALARRVLDGRALVGSDSGVVRVVRLEDGQVHSDTAQPEAAA